jgi:hypothetical protein
MGRTWDALKREAGVASENEPSRAAPAAVEDAEPMLVEPEEIPFIEVGPRKSMEASPSVLAYGRQKEQGERTPHVADPAPAKMPVPRGVLFRAVFLAAPESEPEA